MSHKIPSALLLTVTATASLAMVFGSATASTAATSRSLKVGSGAVAAAAKAESSTITTTASAAGDAFTREVASGWGSASTGGAWTTSGATSFRVTGGKGQAQGIKPGGTMRAVLASSSALDVDNAVDFTVANAGASQYLSVDARKQNGSQAAYRATARVEPTGAVLLSIRRVSATGAETTLVASKQVGTVAFGGTLRVQLAVSGTTSVSVSARAWTGSVTPAWQQVATDASSARVATAGALAYSYYVSSTATRTVNTALDNVAATKTTTVTNPGSTASTPVVTTPVVTTPITPPVSTGVKRNASNTGVPAGTVLKTYTGPLTITTPGTVLDGYRINGNLWIKAKNVTIKNSYITSGVATSVQGAITVQPEGAGFVLQDSNVYVANKSVKLDGVKGGGFTLRRVNVSGGVDNVKAYGNDVTIVDSYLHDTDYYSSDPLQGGKETHNDNIQVQGGDNIVIQGNTLIQKPTQNSGLQVTQDYAALTRFSFVGNNVNGGFCSANFNHKKRTELRGFVFTKNVFGRNTKYRNCAYITSSQVFSASDVSTNKFADGVAVTQKYM